MNRFLQVKQILDTAVGGPTAIVGGPHQAFWRNKTRDQFVVFQIQGLPIVTLGDGAGSNMVKALRGQAPFGQDVGTPGATIDRMPAGLDPVPDDQIAIIAGWIDDGCPDEADAIGRIEATVAGAAPGSAFLIVSDTARSTSGSLWPRIVGP